MKSFPLEAYPSLLLVRFLFDATLTGASAWMLVCANRERSRGLLEIILAWLWTTVALIAGAGIILAEIGGLSGNGFLLMHAGLFAGLALWRRGGLRNDWLTLAEKIRDVRKLFDGRTAEGVLISVLFLMLAALVALAALSEPIVYDAQAYHLPRIAQWLQDGRVQILRVEDERLNFVTGLPDLVMAWFLTATPAGFPLVNLIQSLGGLMAFMATIGLARKTGLRRVPSLLAASLLFGMANVVVQFTATQTDLFTTGVLAAAFYLWLCAHQRGQGSIMGGLGAGLALAAKGTLFYLAPGLVIWVVWQAVSFRASWRAWQTTLLAALAGILFFAGPGFLRNWRAYGGVFGPREWVGKLHHRADSVVELGQKLRWNLQATLVQNIEPNSQPWLLQEWSRTAGMKLAQSLPEQDKFSLDNGNRRQQLQKSILSRREPDADATSFGMVSIFLFLMGTIVALCSLRRDDSRLVLAWSSGLALSLLFFETMQQWHPYAFRYFVLAGPWIAVVAAWGIEQLGKTIRLLAWTLVLLATVSVGWTVTTHTHQAGWRAATAPDRSIGYFITRSWREWSERLDSRDAPFSIALPEERPLAGFYRETPRRVVHLRREDKDVPGTAEAFIAGNPGWTIVPANRFLGREGRVRAETWLNRGSESDPYSLAAYRLLQPGEQPVPVIYRHRQVQENGRVTDEWLVKNWGSEPVQFSLNNSSVQECHYRIASPIFSSSGTLSANQKAVVNVSLPATEVSEIIVIFSDVSPSATGANSPSVDLIANP